MAEANPDALFSVGIHPWELEELDDVEVGHRLELLREAARHPRVAAIGEAGLDALRGGSLERQMRLLRAQVAVSEEVGKPLVLHVVRTGHQIMQLRKELAGAVRQPWIWHGFRGNPAQAAQFLKFPDTYVSLGEHFNPQAARDIPLGRLLAETDESQLPIAEIIGRVAQARGMGVTELTDALASAKEALFGPMGY